MGLGPLNIMRRLSESSGGRTSWERGRQFYRPAGYQPEGEHMQSSVPVVPLKPALETKGYIC
jgi:hypothetical protein